MKMSSTTHHINEISQHDSVSEHNMRDIELDDAMEDKPVENQSTFSKFKDETVKNGKVLSACGFYSFCSVSMVLANKSLASRYLYLKST
jgi:hypothetical protein